MRYNLIAIFLTLSACGLDDVDSGASETALTVPAEIDVEAGNHIVARYHGIGFQTYDCVDGAYKFHSPLAILTADDGSLVVNHFGGIDVGLPAGVYWQSTLDGSRVHAGNAVTFPNPGAIPLVRLSTLDVAGHGILSDVTFIQRLDTTGGLAPTGTCHRQARLFVPYTATYVFWAKSLPRPEVPEAIVVDEGHDVAYIGHVVTGVQTYECAIDATGNQSWRFRSPTAALADDAGLFISHFGGVDKGLPAGVYWQSTRDGSRIHAGNAVTSPNPGAIPLVRLAKLDSAGNGIMSRVSFIQRLATQGGVGPTGACEPLDARVEVPYIADYYFYVPQR